MPIDKVLYSCNTSGVGMVSPGRHPKKEIARALNQLDPQVFEVVEVHRGHRWGIVRCRVCGKAEPIWSTPDVPENNAKRVRAFARRHDHELGA